jgi:hypothetical protein
MDTWRQQPLDEFIEKHDGVEIPLCFYCQVPIAKGSGQRDHFPMPKSCGGDTTVWACTPCHDVKDRFRLDDLPIEVLQEILTMGRWGRILMAKLLRLGFEMQQRNQASVLVPER